MKEEIRKLKSNRSGTIEYDSLDADALNSNNDDTDRHEIATGEFIPNDESELYSETDGTIQATDMKTQLKEARNKIKQLQATVKYRGIPLNFAQAGLTGENRDEKDRRIESLTRELVSLSKESLTDVPNRHIPN